MIIRKKTPGEVSNFMWWSFAAITMALLLALATTPARAADSYTTNLRIVQQVPGSNDSTWGTKANAAFAMLDEAISKVTTVSVTAGDVTLTSANNATDQARSAVLIFTGTAGVSRNVTAPNVQKTYYLYNNSDAAVVFKGGAGTTVTVGVGNKAVVYTDAATNAASILVSPTGAIVGTTDTQTLTNKTLTLPIIASISNGGTLTLPAGADTILGRASTDTLTNKSISGATNTLSAIANASLTNSSITIGGASTALGGTVTASTILDSIGSTRGMVLYRGAAGWAALGVGSSGNVLTSGGAGADPAWSAVGGATTLTGDVTGTGTGSFATTIANNAVTSAKILNSTITYSDIADVATTSILGRTTAGTGVIETLTAAQARTVMALGTIALHNYSIATVAGQCHSGGASGDVCYEY